MAAETKEVQTSQAEPEEQKAAKRKLPKGRRYVGSRETFTYVLFDIAQSFNLDQNKTYYLTDVLVISYWWQAIISVVVSIWDIINDLFLASIVDRTNTRFGKFKPYLIIYALFMRSRKQVLLQRLHRMFSTEPVLSTRRTCSQVLLKIFRTRYVRFSLTLLTTTSSRSR